MKFYSHNEVPIRSDDRIFKVPVGGLEIGFAVCLCLLGCLIWVWVPEQFLRCFLEFWVALFSWLCFLGLRAALKPTNWLLRCNKTGLIIKYRCYWNWKMPAEDVQTVGLEYSEIAWVRTAKERRTVGMSGESSAVQNFLDLCLVNPDTSDLEKHLDAEQKQPHKHWRMLSYPVEVLPGGIIRLKWQNAGGGAYSNAKQAVKWLSRYVKVAPEESAKVNLAHEIHLAPQEEDAKILKLARSGDRIKAVALTREIYGASLTEAVAYVDKLTGSKGK